MVGRFIVGRFDGSANYSSNYPVPVDQCSNINVRAQQ